MHKERLQQMVTMLRGLPPEQRGNAFNLQLWHCGTSACAVGYACLNPSFNQQGLVLGKNMFSDPEPVFNGRKSWEAVESFFEISPMDSERLFADWRYDNRRQTEPDEVADRIESFLASVEV